MDYRIERDSMGEMEVPADRYWGAQTQRSYQNFQIGTEKMPEEIVRAFGILKKAAALANHRLGKLDDERLGLISRACDEVVAGKLDGHFPLVVWQTGSGTQSNMNVNEVVANRGNELAGKKLLHPNDHVNMSQSSNDTFPTAMHIAAAVALEDKLLPAIDGLVETFRRLEGENGDVVKSGRTHLQDAVPITLAQEISGWRTSLEKDRAMVELALPGLRELALGVLAPTCTYFFGAFRKSTISSSSSFSSFRPATSANVTLISSWFVMRARLFPKFIALAFAPPF